MLRRVRQAFPPAPRAGKLWRVAHQDPSETPKQMIPDGLLGGGNRPHTRTAYDKRRGRRSRWSPLDYVMGETEAFASRDVGGRANG